MQNSQPIIPEYSSPHSAPKKYKNNCENPISIEKLLLNLEITEIIEIIRLQK